MKLKNMGEEYRPQYIFRTIKDITPQTLLDAGVRAVAVDIDNTLAYDSTLQPFADAEAWISDVKAAGIPIMILTNTNHFRAKILGKKLGLSYICKAAKPDPAGYLRCAEQLGADIEQLAMIGDQLRTDVRGANNAGAVSILVRPRHREILMAVYYAGLRRTERAYLKKIGIDETKL